MNPIMSILIPVLVLAICPFQIHAQQPLLSAVGVTDLISKTCSSTPHTDLCKTILQSSPKSNGADLYGLAEIALDIAAENVSNIYESINKLQNNTTDNFIDQCLTDCLETFQDAIDQIEDSVTALEFKAYNDVKTWVAAAMSDAASCEQGFKEKPGYQSPLSEMNAVFNQICSICLAITQLLAGDSIGYGI